MFSRRPDAFLNPQFWAEDGKVWYADAYNNGILYSLFTPEAGYYQTISRLSAIFAQLFPFSYGPLIFNLTAISIKLIVVNFLASSRFENLIPRLSVRLLIALIYLALPHTFETHANLTNVQWHLGFLAFLILIASPPKGAAWKIFDFTTVLLSSVSGPLCLLLLPVAIIKLVLKREKTAIVPVLILALGAAIQISSLLTTDRPSGQTLGADFMLAMKIIGGHLFVSSMIGEKGHGALIKRGLWNDFTAILVNIIGFAIFIYGFIKAKLELRLLIIFSFMIFVSAMASPAISSSFPQWTVMWLPGAGSRYWLIPIFCFLITLLFFALNAPPMIVRYASVLLLLLSITGIIFDWKYPAYKDLDFQSQAKQFENAPSGQEVFIPINPDWTMRLVKK